LPLLRPGSRGGAENEAAGQAQRASQGLPASPNIFAAFCPHFISQYLCNPAQTIAAGSRSDADGLAFLRIL
nr:hypothetical protein [Tanacetum cinerariifolium]